MRITRGTLTPMHAWSRRGGCPFASGSTKIPRRLREAWPRPFGVATLRYDTCGVARPPARCLVRQHCMLVAHRAFRAGQLVRDSPRVVL